MRRFFAFPEGVEGGLWAFAIPVSWSRAQDGATWIPAFSFEPAFRVSTPASDGMAFNLDEKLLSS
jgi:hypothetical protein